MIMSYSEKEFWEARGVENQLLTVVESCGFTLSPKGVLATFTFPVFSVSSPRGSSLGFMRTPPPPKKIPSRRIIVDSPRSTLLHSAASSLFSLPLGAEWLCWNWLLEFALLELALLEFALLELALLEFALLNLALLETAVLGTALLEFALLELALLNLALLETAVLGTALLKIDSVKLGSARFHATALRAS
jgi:hypothetical protein